MRLLKGLAIAWGWFLCHAIYIQLYFLFIKPMRLYIDWFEERESAERTKNVKPDSHLYTKINDDNWLI